MASELTIRVLNDQKIAAKTPKSHVSGPELSRKLQKTMLRIEGECMEESSRGIDYDKLKKSSAFQEYKSHASSLQNVDLDSLSELERKAFFIIQTMIDWSKAIEENIPFKYVGVKGMMTFVSDVCKYYADLYNALTIHGLAEQEVLPKSVLDIQQFWKTTGYKIGDYIFSLDDIEHGILRGNRSHPASTNPQFSEKDPRKKYIVKRDPRIHFALVCGAVSCPAIRVYTSENLDAALDMATKNFCSSEVSMFTEVDEIWLSKIFSWYREDFGVSEVEVIKWTFPYLEKDIQDRGHVLLFKLQNLGKVDVKYNEYDWRLNKLGVTPLIL